MNDAPKTPQTQDGPIKALEATQYTEAGSRKKVEFQKALSSGEIADGRRIEITTVKGKLAGTIQDTINGQFSVVLDDTYQGRKVMTEINLKSHIGAYARRPWRSTFIFSTYLEKQGGGWELQIDQDVLVQGWRQSEELIDFKIT